MLIIDSSEGEMELRSFYRRRKMRRVSRQTLWFVGSSSKG